MLAGVEESSLSLCSLTSRARTSRLNPASKPVPDPMLAKPQPRLKLEIGKIYAMF